MSPGYRTANRFVEYEIEITGEPIVWHNFREGCRSISVESIQLRFGHGDGGYFVEVSLLGPYLTKAGRSLKSQANDSAGPMDLWPTWLTALVEQHRPWQYLEHRGLLA